MRKTVIPILMILALSPVMDLPADAGMVGTELAYNSIDHPGPTIDVPGSGDTLILPDFDKDPGTGIPDDNPDDMEPEDGFIPVEHFPPGPPPPVFYNLSELPPAVASTRERIIAAAKTGNLDALRPLLTAGSPATAVSTIDGGDPVDIIKAQSGDPEGIEMLAILVDILDSGWAKVDVGSEEERYVWPYFAEYPLDALKPPQLVELFQILTAGDLDGMRSSGNYEFYRVEIDKNGRWRTFMAGD